MQRMPFFFAMHVTCRVAAADGLSGGAIASVMRVPKYPADNVIALMVAGLAACGF